MVRTRQSDNQPEYEDRQNSPEDAEEMVKRVPVEPIQQQQQVRVAEVEVTLSLLNQKLNYLIGLIERNI